MLFIGGLRQINPNESRLRNEMGRLQWNALCFLTLPKCVQRRLDADVHTLCGIYTCCCTHRRVDRYKSNCSLAVDECASESIRWMRETNEWDENANFALRTARCERSLPFRLFGRNSVFFYLLYETVSLFRLINSVHSNENVSHFAGEWKRDADSHVNLHIWGSQRLDWRHTNLRTEKNANESSTWSHCAHSSQMLLGLNFGWMKAQSIYATWI